MARRVREPEIVILLPHGRAVRAGARRRDRAPRPRRDPREPLSGIASGSSAPPSSGRSRASTSARCSPAWHGLRGRNIGLAEQLRRGSRGRQGVLVEVYNRPNMFAHLAARAPDLPLTLRLSNDPRTMRGARTPAERARLLARARAIFCVSDFVRAALPRTASTRAARRSATGRSCR